MSEKFRFSGARAEYNDPAFWFSTSDVEQYLQTKIDLIVANLKKSSPEYASLENINVRVAGWMASNLFVPMVLVLSPNVLESRANGNATEDIPSIYLDDEDEDSEARLIPAVYNYLKLFSFYEDHVKLFRNQKWLNEYKLSKNVGLTLTKLSKPSIKRIKKGEETESIVMLLIDPIEMFHDMLTDEVDKQRKFNVDIETVKKIRNGEYQYKVRRRRGGKNKKNKDRDIIKDIEHILRTSR